MINKSLLSCSYNTRELGGIKTADGNITQNNVYWRSDVPLQPAAEDIEKLLTARITTIIDMRTDEEVKKSPDMLSETAGFIYYNFPISEGSGVPESLEAVPYSYMDIATAKNMSEVLKVLAEAESGVLYHCTAGKDRTGVVSAIILMLCGVERETIVRDYVVSREYNHKRLAAFLEAHPWVDRNIVLANEKSMNGFIDMFNTKFGNVECYFEAIGLTAQYTDIIRKKLMKGI
jgi:protein-tyrosine phosphatase